MRFIVEWTTTAAIHVEADSEEDAIVKAKKIPKESLNMRKGEWRAYEHYSATLKIGSHDAKRA